MDISNIKPQQLRKAADLQEKILELQQQINELLGGAFAETAPQPVQTARAGKGKRRLSAQAIANIRAGVAKRMARRAQSVSAAGPNGEPRRRMSAAGRRALSLAAKARWAKAKATGQNKL